MYIYIYIGLHKSACIYTKGEHLLIFANITHHRVSADLIDIISNLITFSIRLIYNTTLIRYYDVYAIRKRIRLIEYFTVYTKTFYGLPTLPRECVSL